MNALCLVSQCPVSSLSVPWKLATGNQDAATAKLHSPAAETTEAQLLLHFHFSSILQEHLFGRAEVTSTMLVARESGKDCVQLSCLCSRGCTHPASQSLVDRVHNFPEPPICKLRIVSISQGLCEDSVKFLCVKILVPLLP